MRSDDALLLDIQLNLLVPQEEEDSAAVSEVDD